jgi:hypothetical protein
MNKTGNSMINSELKPNDSDHPLVKDGYLNIVGDLSTLFSGHFLAGLLTRLRGHAERDLDKYRSRLLVGSVYYDAFEFGSYRADIWVLSLTEYLKTQYQLLPSAED